MQMDMDSVMEMTLIMVFGVLVSVIKAGFFISPFLLKV
jgi:hypothetical protein